jgi:hypothetical protein
MSVYSIVSISRCVAPAGQSGNDWFCYILSNQCNNIVGYRRGTLQEVKKVVQECRDHLNQKLKGLAPRQFVRNAVPVADVDPLSAA